MFNEIKYVWAVYEERSFTKAAKKLFISQPALSNMIKKVEQEVGAPIFDRSTIPLSLTAEGQFYIQSIRDIMMIEQNIYSYFEDIRNLEKGSLSVGGSSFFCSFILPELMGIFKRRYPKVSIDIVEGNLQDLKSKLENNVIDIMIETAIQEQDPLLDTYLYKEESIILAIPAGMPINEKLVQYQCTYDELCQADTLENLPALPLEYVSKLPFILLKNENDLGRRAISICKDSGFDPEVIMYTDQILTAFNISATGIGVTFTRLDLFRYLPYENKFCLYYLKHPLAHRKIFFATYKGRYLQSAAREFLKMFGNGQ